MNSIGLGAPFVILCLAADISLALACDADHKRMKSTSTGTATVVETASANDTAACTVADGWTVLTAETGDSTDTLTTASIDLSPDTIVSEQPFSFKLKLCATELKKPQRLTTDATMPAHKHGMNYTPTVTQTETTDRTASYQLEDFVFHMPGEWEISVSTYHNDVATHYTHTVTLK